VVGGVTVANATHHNEEDINRKDIREGDTVIVQRAGDVIPQVVGPVLPHAKGSKPFRMPARCPLCDAEIVKPEGEVMHRCPNRACPSRGLETLIHWVGAAMDIEGVGEQFVRRLWDEGLLRSMPDLYRLTSEQLQELEGYGEISAAKIVEAIELSKAQPFSTIRSTICCCTREVSSSCARSSPAAAQPTTSSTLTRASSSGFAASWSRLCRATKNSDSVASLTVRGRGLMVAPSWRP